MASSDDASVGTFAIGSSTENSERTDTTALSVSNSSETSGAQEPGPMALPATVVPAGDKGKREAELAVESLQDSVESEWELAGGMQCRRAKSASVGRATSYGPAPGKLALKDNLRPRPLTPRKGGSGGQNRPSSRSRGSREGTDGGENDHESRQSARSRSPPMEDEPGDAGVYDEATQIVEGAMKVAQQAQSRLDLSQKQNAHLARMASTATDAATAADVTAKHYQSEALMHHQHAEHHAQQSHSIARQSMERTAIVGAAHEKLKEELKKAHAALSQESDHRANCASEMHNAELGFTNLKRAEEVHVAALTMERQQLVQTIRNQEMSQEVQRMELLKHEGECKKLHGDMARLRAAASETHVLATVTEQGIMESKRSESEHELRMELAKMNRDLVLSNQRVSQQEHAVQHAQIHIDRLNTEMANQGSTMMDTDLQLQNQTDADALLRLELSDVKQKLMDSKQTLSAQELSTRTEAEKTRKLEEELESQQASYKKLYDRANGCIEEAQVTERRAGVAEEENERLKQSLEEAQKDRQTTETEDETKDSVTKDRHEQIVGVVRSELLSSLSETAAKLKLMKQQAAKAVGDAQWFKERNEDLEEQIEEYQHQVNTDGEETLGTKKKKDRPSVTWTDEEQLKKEKEERVAANRALTPIAKFTKAEKDRLKKIKEETKRILQAALGDGDEEKDILDYFEKRGTTLGTGAKTGSRNRSGSAAVRDGKGTSKKGQPHRGTQRERGRSSSRAKNRKESSEEDEEEDEEEEEESSEEDDDEDDDEECPHLVSSDSEAEGEGEKRNKKGPILPKRRRKEADKLKISKFPTIVTLHKWRIRLSKLLCVAGGYSDKAEVGWISECHKKNEAGILPTFESLEEPGKRFEGLDMLLSEALPPLLPSDLSNKVYLKEQEAYKLNKVMSGRQIVWMIYEYLRTRKDMEVVYGIRDLLLLEWKGDDKMDDFRMEWKQVVDNMSEDTQLQDTALEDILGIQMKKSVVLKEDLAHYDREPIGTAHHCYQYLLDCMERYLARQLEKKNLEARLTKKGGKNSSGLLVNAAPVTEGGGEEPKKKKKRSKSKSKKKKNGSNPQGAEVTAAPAGNGSDSRGRSLTRGDGKESKVCRFYQKDMCNKGNECQYTHIKLEGEALEELMKGWRSPSREPSASGKGSKGKGKGKGKARLSGPVCCTIFLRTGACPYEVCKFEHINADQWKSRKDKMDKEKQKKSE